jgi:DNA-binding transcriptional MerR regulator|tara:strand:+ start:711 stop:989 length:279 start_codon:yes stop_codon:yes gene_type:complete
MKASTNNNHNKEDYEVGKYIISVAERLTGAHAHHIRRLSRAGLLNPERTDAGQRLFSDADIDIIKEVSELEIEGINLPGVKAILEMRRGQRS